MTAFNPPGLSQYATWQKLLFLKRGQKLRFLYFAYRYQDLVEKLVLPYSEKTRKGDISLAKLSQFWFSEVQRFLEKRKLLWKKDPRC